MPLPGSKPNEGRPVRHRNPPRQEWEEVENRPHRGGPRLPPTRPSGRFWPEPTKRWWRVICRMPHVILWTEADWQFALDTAEVAAAFHDGDLRQAVELRQRERIMGTTVDARRDLRIRYLEPMAQEQPASVTAIEDYRRALER